MTVLSAFYYLGAKDLKDVVPRYLVSFISPAHPVGNSVFLKDVIIILLRASNFVAYSSNALLLDLCMDVPAPSHHPSYSSPWPLLLSLSLSTSSRCSFPFLLPLPPHNGLPMSPPHLRYTSIFSLSLLSSPPLSLPSNHYLQVLFRQAPLTSLLLLDLVL